MVMVETKADLLIPSLTVHWSCLATKMIVVADFI